MKVDRKVGHVTLTRSREKLDNIQQSFPVSGTVCTGRCLGLVGEALACKICLRGECSDQRCTLELARYVVALIEFKYYIYFISHGQATAHGGHAGLPEAKRVFCTFMSHILTQRAYNVYGT